VIQLKTLRFLIGRNVLVDYCLPRGLKFPLLSDLVLEDVFEGGLEGMDGALISVRLFGGATELGWQQQ
jgi:hypothetical protein